MGRVAGDIFRWRMMCLNAERNRAYQGKRGISIPRGGARCGHDAVREGSKGCAGKPGDGPRTIGVGALASGGVLRAVALHLEHPEATAHRPRKVMFMRIRLFCCVVVSMHATMTRETRIRFPSKVRMADTAGMNHLKP
jgi:hypothetical protein